MNRATSESHGGTMPNGLAAALASRGFGRAAADWSALGGGRTNLVWRQNGAAEGVVCKLYRPEAGTPLFPNDSEAEGRALAALAGTGLAPAFRERLKWAGQTCLVYRFVAGQAGAAGAAETLRALAALHRLTPPEGLRRAASGADAVLEEGLRMLRDASGAHHVRLICAVPTVQDLPPGPPGFLHGDPVPFNVVARPEGGVAFIDWQCPATGDPVHDIALALSPSMRLANGLGPLTPDETAAALDAYGEAEVAWRYRRWRPALAWRLACHAAWRLARGDDAYRAGFDAELALAERLDHQDDQRHAARAEPDHGGTLGPFRA